MATVAMATAEVKKEMGFPEKDEEEKWKKHYSSNHQILLVGDGDFSFSLCLALAFGSASNICASSLDSNATVIKKYKNAKSNLETLKKMGASILHEVAAKRMKCHPDLQKRKFDRIIFNFPHAGFYGKEDNPELIKMHKSLVKNFFSNASGMLRANGEVHVNHKTTAPFSNWHIEELASKSSLSLIGCPEFKIEDYPDYNNKRGQGSKCDNPFPLGQCRTFIFEFSPSGKKKSGGKSSKGFTRERSHLHQEIPIQIQKQKIPFDLRYPHTNSTMGTNEASACVRLSKRLNIQRERPTIFDGCFNSAGENFGRAGNGVSYFAHESSGFGSFRHFQTSFPGNMNYLGLPLTSYFQRENARISGDRFSNVNETLGRVSNDVGYPVRKSVIPFQRYMDEAPGFQRVNARIYDGHFNNVNETITRVGNDVGYSVHESLIPFTRYREEAPGRTSNGYKYVMEELHRQRTSRLE